MIHFARRSLFLLALVVPVLLTACGSSSDTTTTAVADTHTAAVETVAPQAAAGLAADGTHTVLDVRTPEEFDSGHLEDAVNIDFYEAAFADEIAQLDRDASYVLYCRSGNRSGQTLALMRELGFTDVHDVAGGIVAWSEAGLPITGN